MTDNLTDQYFELQLINFRCWTNSTFIFKRGLNLLNGESGSGKSTICEAIYFALYGSLKNVSSKDCKEKETRVILTFVSPSHSYQIIRGRPAFLTIESRKVNEHFNLSKTDAQNWINQIFGTPKVWMSSAYLSQGARQFLMTSSNMEKMNLFQEITFGDVSELNSPEYYTLKLKSVIVQITESINRNCNSKQIYEGIAYSFRAKNEPYFCFGLIDEATSQNDEISKNNLSISLNTYIKLYHEMEQTKKIKKSIETLPVVSFNLEDEEKISSYSLYLEHMKLKSSLPHFDFYMTLQPLPDHEVIKRDLFLYFQYIEEGYSPDNSDNFDDLESIQKFIESLKKKKDEYDRYLQELAENEQIKLRNINNLNMYNQQMQLYQQKRKEYDNYLTVQRNYDSVKLELLTAFDSLIIFFPSKNLSPSVNSVNQGNQAVPEVNQVTLISSFFRDRVLNETINRDSSIYNNYIRMGWKHHSNIDDFISNLKEQTKKYEEYCLQAEESRKLQMCNVKNKEINSLQKRSYEDKKDKYLKFCSQQALYLSWQNKYNSFVDNNPKTIIQIKNYPEVDDFSSSYSFKVISHLEILIKELLCPHCENGIIYSDGILCKGSLTISEKEYYSQQLEFCKAEYIKRKQYETIEKDFSQIRLPEKIEEPVEEKYLDIYPISVITPVIKPNIEFNDIPEYNYDIVSKFLKCRDLYQNFISMTLPEKVEEPLLIKKYIPECELNIIRKEKNKYNVFDVPTYSYNKVQKIDTCFRNLDAYYKVSQYDGPIFSNENEIFNEYHSLKRKMNDYKKYLDSKEILFSQLKHYPEIDETLPSKIQEIENSINSLNFRIECGKIVREYMKTYEAIQNYEREIYRETNICNTYIKMSKLISELGSRYIQETIDDVNSSIKMILEELFAKPIDVKISSHRTLKSGDEKLEINLEISYNGLTYDSPSFLSGGEQDRISLALLLAFSRVRNAPIILLDEVIASLDSVLREKAVEIISKWGEGKVILHCCHEIVQGIHDYLINF